MTAMQAERAAAGRSSALRPVLFILFALFSLTPAATPGLALGLGAALGLSIGNPFPRASARWSKMLLQGCVVGLGFGMPLAAVLRAGATGVGYTVAGIAVALAAGLALGRWLGVGREPSILITAGTSICGGSAIAAVGPAIGARAESMSVALATVFLLNAVALYVFPPIGGMLGLTEEEFAIWAALAIHDTSSVVGAAAVYGPESLQQATVLKLARALWIVPLTFAAAWYAGRGATDQVRGRVKVPWFIGLFILAAVVRTVLPVGVEPLLDGVARAARIGLVLALFLIGAGLTRDTLRAVGTRPLAQGVSLWVAMAVLTLLAATW